MAIYKPSELKIFLAELGIYPKKGLSQNFLIDGNIIRKIIETADVKAGDLVLEIGPGPGSLTEALLAAGAEVIAVEKDPVLAKALERLQSLDNRLTVYQTDILEFALENIPRQAKLIANLPYHLTTPILTHFIPQHSLFSTICVMVQEEVARRFTAQPSTSDYGSITVFLQFFSNPQFAFTVSRHCFYPEPNVDSAVVRFDLKQPPFENYSKFFELTRKAFGQRRKTIRSSLHKTYPNIQKAIESLHFNPSARPEELSLQKWIELYNFLT